MTWAAISAVGEIIGAAAVVVSLIYLAIQIRTQNSETKLAAMREISVAFRDSLTTFTNGDLAELFARGNEDYDGLSTAEIMRLISGLYPTLRVWEQAYVLHEQGRLEERIWVAINNQYTAYLSYPAINRIWSLRKQYFDKNFQQFVKGLEKTEIKLK